MSFFDFLEKIQNKSKYIRIQILWLAVFASMFIIVSLWLISFKYSSESTANKETETSVQITQPIEEIKKGIPSLKETFKAAIGAFFEDDLEKEAEELNQPESTKEPEQESAGIKPAKLPLVD